MYLEGFQTNITPSTNGFTITYTQGECKGSVSYVKYVSELGRIMKGRPVYLMVNSDMGDVIECIHQKSPLSSEDFNDINMEIRTHSRETLESFLKINR